MALPIEIEVSIVAKLNLIEMTVSGPSVRLLYADGATREQATEWVEMALKLEGDDNRRLGVIQKDALDRLRTLYDEEMIRIRLLSNQIQ